jgi:hypothetical protein
MEEVMLKGVSVVVAAAASRATGCLVVGAENLLGRTRRTTNAEDNVVEKRHSQGTNELGNFIWGSVQASRIVSFTKYSSL